MTVTARKDPPTEEEIAAADRAEFERAAKMTDEQVLKATGHGRFGPAIVGKYVAERSSQLIKNTGGGVFGPAIVDPEFARKQAAKRAAAEAEGSDAATDTGETDTGDGTEEITGDIDSANLDDPRNPWHYITLSGAKMLAQTARVSHTPRVKKADLIAMLQAAKVVPPPVPTDADAPDPEP